MSEITDHVPPEPPVETAKGIATSAELSHARQTLARRAAESRATIPDFELQADVDMEACIALREQLSGDGAPTYNDMIVRASALALAENLRGNAGYRDGVVQMHSRINVAVVVAVDDAQVSVTVFDADGKSLSALAHETRALAERARSGEITPPELGGSTFTVSNLGMFGVDRFSAIISPGQAAVLAVGAIGERAVSRGGELSSRRMLTLTLACDQRTLDGAEAARLLTRIRELLETPSALTG